MQKQPQIPYTIITVVYMALFTLLASLVRRSTKTVEKPTGSEIFLIGLATYRLSRIISHDRVTQYLRMPFVETGKGTEQVEGTQEEPKGEGLQRAIGELVTCTYCSSVWAGTFNSAIYYLFPRTGRLFLLSMAGSGLAEIFDPIFPLLSYLSGYMKKKEKQEEAKMENEELYRPDQ
jgi:hypothetical protein